MNYKNYFKQRIVESIINEDSHSRKREPRTIDPHNYGLPPMPGFMQSHGDAFDKSDIITHHATMLKQAVANNNETEIARHSRAIQNAGGDLQSIIEKIKKGIL
jgi:hypothetical protein